jgi:RNA polymerase sigma factor (sigma-70 family)
MVVTTESELVARAQAGDRTAFASLYDTYLTKIYDFALGMLRNPADAEDVTSDTFLKAVERLGGLKDHDAFRGWLYAIARNSALSLIESRKRAVPTAEHDEHATAMATQMMAAPDAEAEQAELRDLVWDAAETLNPRDFQVFELTVRHGLGSAEIADILGVRPAYAYILVNRLKGSVEEALETVLLTRTGRTDCPELDRVVSGYEKGSAPRMRKAVARHAKSCAICEETKRGKASVPAILAGMAFAAPSTAFASELAAKIDRAWPPSSFGGSGGGSATGRGLAHLFTAAGIIVALTAGTLGATAQRSIHEVEEFEPVAQETSETPSPTPEPTEEPDVFVPPAATQRPVPVPPTPFVIVDDFDNDADETPEPDDDTPEPTRPPITEPPKQTDPPPRQPPIG